MLRAVLGDVGPTVAPAGLVQQPRRRADLDAARRRLDTEFLVVEMGAAGPGEIARLVAIARPDTGVVLKVGLAHAGGFGGIEAHPARQGRDGHRPARDRASPSSTATTTGSPAWPSMTAARVVWFGLATRRPSCAPTTSRPPRPAPRFTLDVDGERPPVHLRILGEHHVMNALAALAVAGEWGLDLDRAVTALEGVARAERWRMEVLDGGDGVTVINDAYNASPDSVAAALKTLVQIVPPGQRSVAVLGEMAELGEFAARSTTASAASWSGSTSASWSSSGAARHIHVAAGLEGSWDGESVLVADRRRGIRSAP